MKHDADYFTVGVLFLTACALLLIYFFAGCAPMRFVRADATPGNLSHDAYDCDREWDRSGPGIATAQDPLGSLGYLAMARGDKEACMARKGWRRVDE